MDADLDSIIKQVEGLDHETRNALVHMAAERLAAQGVLAVIRSHTEKDGSTFDLYRSKRTGKTYITRRPDIPDEKRVELEQRLARMLGTRG
jgi:hypothetical protein